MGSRERSQRRKLVLCNGYCTIPLRQSLAHILVVLIILDHEHILKLTWGPVLLNQHVKVTVALDMFQGSYLA